MKKGILSSAGSCFLKGVKPKKSCHVSVRNDALCGEEYTVTVEAQASFSHLFEKQILGSHNILSLF